MNDDVEPRDSEFPFLHVPEEIAVILPARAIPNGSTVTKRTGKAEFTLVDRITIYADKNVDTKPQQIEAGPGVMFLIGPRGGINAISDQTKLVWITNVEMLIDHLQAEIPQ